MMSPTDVRSPTRLPQPMSPTSPSEDAVKSKESRRRSLLPQRSTSGGSARPMTVSGMDGLRLDGAAEVGSGAQAEESTRRRQMLGSVAEGAHSSDGEEDAAAVAAQRQAALDALMGDSGTAPSKGPAHVRAPSGQVRQSRMIPKPGVPKSAMPPPSGLGRTSSIRKPTTVTDSTARPERSSRMPPPSAAASAVSRNQSKHVATSSTSSARPSSRSSTTTTTSGRPPSSSSARPPSASSTTGRTSNTESSVTSLKRNSSTREPSKPSLRPTSTMVPNLQAKPQFTTYQQHYSPKKDFAPKPLTSSFLPKASSAPTRSALELPSADTLRQQTELLQLSIMHEQALPCFAAYQASAERKLQKRFDALARRCRAVQEVERAERTARNAAALKEWGAGVGGLQENVRVLSGVMRELSALQRDDDGEGHGQFGRFDRLVRQFVQWAQGVEDIWRSRESHSHSSDLEILEPLPPEWHAEVAALQRKVTLLVRELDCLDVPAPGSSVADVSGGARASLGGIGEELRVMKALAGAVMVREMAWVDDEVEKMGFGGADGLFASA